MEITFMQYLWGFLLLLIPCYVLYLYHSTLLTKTVRATVRMMGLLLVLGFLLYEVMELNQWGITLLFALLMVTIGAILTVRRAKLPIRQLFVPVMAGTLAGVLVVGLYVLWLVVGVRNPLEVRFLIPVVGLLTGHLIQVNSQALHIYFMGLRHHSQLYHYLLGNGMKHSQALGYLFRRAIERAALPNISTMGRMLIGVSPIVLWSMMLAGAGVFTALAFQLVLLIAMFSASMISVIVTVVVSRRYLLDDYHQLKGDKPHQQAQ